nr:keratin-associated protein 13-1-like [Meriones unguiculatus]
MPNNKMGCCCPPQDPPVALPAPATCSTAPTAAPASTFQLDSSLSSGCQETCIEPTSCQRSCVVSSPCQMPCYYPRSCTPCSPCQGTYAGSLGFQSSIVRCLGYGSRSCFQGGCGFSGFRSLNHKVPVFSSTLCYPTYLLFNPYQPSFCVPTCGPYLSVISC